MEAIASGDVFTVTTSDPETMPLPSWALLETQWFLRQVAGMSGAQRSKKIFLTMTMMMKTLANSAVACQYWWLELP